MKDDFSLKLSGHLVFEGLDLLVPLIMAFHFLLRLFSLDFLGTRIFLLSLSLLFMLLLWLILFQPYFQA